MERPAEAGPGPPGAGEPGGAVRSPLRCPGVPPYRLRCGGQSPEIRPPLWKRPGSMPGPAVVWGGPGGVGAVVLHRPGDLPGPWRGSHRFGGAGRSGQHTSGRWARRLAPGRWSWRGWRWPGEWTRSATPLWPPVTTTMLALDKDEENWSDAIVNGWAAFGLFRRPTTRRWRCWTSPWCSFEHRPVPVCGGCLPGRARYGSEVNRPQSWRRVSLAYVAAKSNDEEAFEARLKEVDVGDMDVLAPTYRAQVLIGPRSCFGCDGKNERGPLLAGAGPQSRRGSCLRTAW